MLDVHPSRMAGAESIVSGVPTHYPDSGIGVQSDQSHRCDWPGCLCVQTFTSQEELQDHKTNVHVKEVCETYPGRCIWPGCRSKAFFKKRHLLVGHVNNIHVNPLVCTRKGCDDKKPFGKKCDLDRHIKSHHSAHQFRCTYDNCPASSFLRDFPRKDKLKKHEREYHGEHCCQLTHCKRGPGNGFSSEDVLRKHMDQGHSTFECAVGSCALTGESRFPVLYGLYNELNSHLEENHGILWIETHERIRTMMRGQVVDDVILEGLEWHDCEGCVAKLKANGNGTSLFEDVNEVRDKDSES